MPEVAVRELTLAEAVREALWPRKCAATRAFSSWAKTWPKPARRSRSSPGLVEEFGKSRVIDTPISEAGFTGIGVGAAMTGMRPVVDIMFGDFLTLVMDQMVNQAAKVHYMSGGAWKVPMVLRTTLGGGAPLGRAAFAIAACLAQPRSRPESGVAVDALRCKGLMKTAIRDDNPVVFFEDKMMFRFKGPVPVEDYTIPFGVADIKREGEDITIVATSSMVQVALGAAATARGNRHQRGSRRSADDVAAG